jgi:TolA-binding protein
VYSDPRVIEFITQHFVPVRVHVKENADAFKALGARYNALWTPTVLVLDGDGAERHRIEGFLPADDFMSQLALGVARSAFQRQDYAIAAPAFRLVADEYGGTEAAPEALYWAGVSQYRATNDPSVLRETGQALRDRFPDSSWAKKGSVWLS